MSEIGHGLAEEAYIDVFSGRWGFLTGDYDDGVIKVFIKAIELEKYSDSPAGRMYVNGHYLIYVAIVFMPSVASYDTDDVIVVCIANILI